MVKYVGKAKPKTKVKPVKKLYAGKYVLECQYIKGWLFKRLKQETITVTANHVALAEAPEEAVDKFINHYNHEYENAPWGTNSVPWWVTRVWYIPGNTVILSESVDAYPIMYDIETLKNKMDADEFLAYCRQELIDPMEVISG